jgi:putative SOS response-associated peptidase YedK
MPVILRQADEGKWLEKDFDKASIDSLLEPYDASQVQAHTIPRLRFTKRANTNVTEVMKRFTYEELEEQATPRAVYSFP